MSDPTASIAIAVPSDKSRGAALALAALLGPFGAHRFYVGKTGTAALMLATLGGLGIWYLYDLILVATGTFTDAQGRPVTQWDPQSASHQELPAIVLDELDSLRAQVAELAERVDFAERLLAQPERRNQSPAATLLA